LHHSIYEKWATGPTIISFFKQKFKRTIHLGFQCISTLLSQKFQGLQNVFRGKLTVLRYPLSANYDVGQNVQSVKIAFGEKFRQSKLPSVKNSVGQNDRRSKWPWSKWPSVKISVGRLFLQIFRNRAIPIFVFEALKIEKNALVTLKKKRDFGTIFCDFIVKESMYR
jgi:hypothetical protein